jgi:lipopolysaccharide export system permease protein
MIIKLFHRYILKNVILSFVVMLVVFTLAITSGNMIKLADFIINKGIGIFVVLKLFLYLIPYLIAFTIPMALLTSCLIVFGKLSHDNEIVALKASGFSFYKIVFPVLIFALMVSFFNLGVNNKLVSSSHYKMRKELVNIGYENPEALIEPGKFIKAFNNYIFYFKEINDNELKQIIIYELENNKTLRTITARRGIIEKSDKESKLTLTLFDGSASEPSPEKEGSFYKLSFKSFPIALELDEKARETKMKYKRLKEMDLGEIAQEIKQLEKKGVKISRYKTEIYKRITFSFSSLVLILVGLPLAIYTRRGEKTIGFAISLVLALVYYLFFMFAESMCQQGYINPAIGMWLPNIIIGIIGIIMMIRVSRH